MHLGNDCTMLTRRTPLAPSRQAEAERVAYLVQGVAAGCGGGEGRRGLRERMPLGVVDDPAPPAVSLLQSQHLLRAGAEHAQRGVLAAARVHTALRALSDRTGILS